MREKFMRFMQGRYGIDQLSKFLIVVGIVLWVITIFFQNNGVYSAALVLIFISYLRAFSKNHQQRYRENEGFLRYYNKVKGFFKGSRKITYDRKNQRVFTCPSCRQKIRVPKGKGKIQIRCPKCGTEFIKKSQRREDGRWIRRTLRNCLARWIIPFWCRRQPGMK